MSGFPRIVPSLSQTKGTNFLLHVLEVQFLEFLLALVMTKLISAILITFQPFGGKFEALPQVCSHAQFTLLYPGSVSALTANMLNITLDTRPLIPMYFLIFLFSVQIFSIYDITI